ncbi:cell division protein SepF [Rhodococcus sp. ABRD24]|uniref:cell division protein SepF n=1 Tax=Rhodococcus sp. ABRD24 TaxID=2507582 RepID=UPI00103F3134|nr:cell division protein SepF [Rhodococcus sp. ABRD24]QBJ94862.1 cell division protein SepF [Rhodococcus sp. ABRD24]
MSTLHKFKAYFGMVPLEDFEDDYIDEPGQARRDYAEPGYAASRRDEIEDDFDRYDSSAPRGSARIEPIAPRATRPAPSAAPRGTTRGALAVDSRMDRLEGRRPTVDEAGPLSKITTLRPRDYGEARTIGERFRDGSPVIMDLVEMSNADAKRLVDFAAGLAFALRGSFDKVATKVFLLSPADIDVSAEERRRIAETGFYNQK